MSGLKEKRWQVVGLGEVLWDIFPDKTRMGGAPANYACAVAALTNCADVSMVAGVGNDELGQQAVRELQQRNIFTNGLQLRPNPTGQVNVRLNKVGNAEYTFAADTAWDDLQWSDSLQQLAQDTDVVCFGTLGQRSPVSSATIQSFVENVPDSGLKIFDVNLRPPFFNDEIIRQSLSLANVLKLNEEELPLVAQLSGVTGSQNELLRQIADAWQLDTIALTLGAEGAVLLHDNKVVSNPGVPTAIADTVGAGDSFTAALTIGFLNHWAIEKIGERATRVAAYVCSQSGATPDFPSALQM